MRVFINGFGRIGRTILRAYAQGAAPHIQIVGINDIAAPDICSYLFEYDSIFGPFAGHVRYENGLLQVNDLRIPFHQMADISALDLRDAHLVMECTGHNGNRAVLERGIQAGAGRVLVSGPAKSADITAVLGANEGEVQPRHLIISNASCTTNALAPLARLIHEGWGIETGSMTTIHCYTGSQPTIDAPAADFARSRAAALSMVPTTTSAQHLVDLVLPELAGRLDGSAVRVPTASVSAIDLCVMTQRLAQADAVNAAFQAAGGVIGVTDRPLVSTDLRGRRESIVMATPETRVTKGGLLRVFGWYDNEWGFSNRMLDMALYLRGLNG